MAPRIIEVLKYAFYSQRVKDDLEDDSMMFTRRAMHKLRVNWQSEISQCLPEIQRYVLPASNLFHGPMEHYGLPAAALTFALPLVPSVSKQVPWH